MRHFDSYMYKDSFIFNFAERWEAGVLLGVEGNITTKDGKHILYTSCIHPYYDGVDSELKAWANLVIKSVNS